MVSSRFATATHLLVALEYLRREGRGLVSSRDLAKSIGTHPAFVRELLQDLRNAELVTAVEGRSGGVRVAREAEKISLRSVYAAVEDRGVLKESSRTIHKPCPVSCAMKELLRPIYREVDVAMLEILDRKNIADLAGSVPGRPKFEQTRKRRRNRK